MHVHLRIAGALLILTTALTSCRGVSPPEPTAINDTAVAALSTAGLWTETFDRLDPGRWIPSSWSGFWQHPGLTGTFQASNAYVDGKGHLVLALKVQSCGAGLCAQAAEIQSAQRFGFGRYTYRMRAASTSANASKAGRGRSGNISGAFSYVDNSATEIDVEIEGNRPATLNAAVWKGLTQKSYAVLSTGTTLGQGFHTYSYEWRPDRITYFLDGARVWETTQNVPQDPAHIMLNIWPTNDDGWGGQATTGTVYMLVDSVTFEPLP
ncbi:family 16 glycosylhydrolase [Deinococcus sp. SM5_A1]|uniref:family 16 glycosylhydrolase n=1 Tax=Deinococcus sp. SM5_A1 TaxID=3379094 RepID=UPI003858FD27